MNFIVVPSYWALRVAVFAAADTTTGAPLLKGMIGLVPAVKCFVFRNSCALFRSSAHQPDGEAASGGP
jgi:hypothetical protein